MAQKIQNITFNNCEIDKMQNADEITNINYGDTYHSYDYKILEQHFDTVNKSSNDPDECKLALEAKKLCSKHDQKGLRALVKAHIPDFTSGTFATVAGGLLLEMIKHLVQ